MPDHVCLVCNLCCDGTLFARLAVTPEERARLSERGTFFTKPDGALRMRLGCNYLGADGACQCYAERPAICSEFRCHLLRSVDAGYRSMAEAIALGQEARALRDKAIDAFAAALAAAGAPPPSAGENVHGLRERLKQLRRQGAPIPEPVIETAEFRYDAQDRFIRQFITRPSA